MQVSALSLWHSARRLLWGSRVVQFGDCEHRRWFWLWEMVFTFWPTCGHLHCESELVSNVPDKGV